MAKKNKKDFKQFNIDALEDGIYVLGTLISRVIVHLEKYKEYCTEASELARCYCSQSGEGTTEVLIPAKVYDDINDKLLYRQREILKYTADHQKSSFSYIDLRQLLEKRGFLTRTLDEETKEILAELLDIRNWTFHNPQSLLTANQEVAEKSIPSSLKGVVKIEYPLNPLRIERVTNYDLTTMHSLLRHNEVRAKQFETVLTNMKLDYSSMYANSSKCGVVVGYGGFSISERGLWTPEIVYLDVPRVARLNDPGVDATLISMAIQKSKYDGTDAAFNSLASNTAQIDEESANTQEE
jgi:hypothetical protein